MGLSTLGVMPFIGIRMSTYDMLMQSIPKYSIALNMLCGAGAGLAATAVCYPIDVIRRLLQLNGTSKEHKYKNIFHIIGLLLKQEGIPGLYRGFKATIAKSIPMTGMMFVFNEQFKIFLNC